MTRTLPADLEAALETVRERLPMMMEGDLVSPEHEALALLETRLARYAAVVEAAKRVRDYAELEDDAYLFDALPGLTDVLAALEREEDV